MEEQATQKATQPYMDQRRDERQVMEDEADQGDVICILHPASPPAYRAVELIAQATPQHILKSRTFNEPQNQDSQAEAQHDVSKDQHLPSTNSFDSGKEAAGEKAGVGASQDIALRLSSRLRNPCMGFVFGRGVTKSDLMLSKEDDYAKRISSGHFRIYFNHLGVLMLEDTSTNGTIVDDEFLKASEDKKTRMIAGGAKIEIILNGQANGFMRFIVTIPERHNAENRFAHNLAKYIAWRDQEERRAQVLAQAAIDGRPPANPPVVCRTVPPSIV